METRDIEDWMQDAINFVNDMGEISTHSVKTKRYIQGYHDTFKKLLDNIEGTVQNKAEEEMIWERIVTLLIAAFDVMERFETYIVVLCCFRLRLRPDDTDDWLLNLYRIEVTQLVSDIRKQRGLPIAPLEHFRFEKYLSENLHLPDNMRLKSTDLTFKPKSITKVDLCLVSKGTYDGQVVAIKVFRGRTHVECSLMGLSCWSSLISAEGSEKYLSKLSGFSISNEFALMAMPLSENGDLVTYLKMRTQVDRKPIILHLANGLQFLHSRNPPIALGVIKASAILVDDSGTPLFADFTYAKPEGKGALHNHIPVRDISKETNRWMAPEILFEGEPVGKKSDIYSFSMAMLEILTGKKPLCHISDGNIHYCISSHYHPLQCYYTGISQPLWGLFVLCWRSFPSTRPDIGTIIDYLGGEDSAQFW